MEKDKLLNEDVIFSSREEDDRSILPPKEQTPPNPNEKIILKD